MNNCLDKLIKELRELRMMDRNYPFPYEGCGKIYEATGKRFKDLVPDLNTYFMDICGYSSWDYKIPKWSSEKAREVKKWMIKSFFEKHPMYHPIESLITEDNTPDLHRQFVIYEN